MTGRFDPWPCAKLWLGYASNPGDEAVAAEWFEQHTAYLAAQALHVPADGRHSPLEQLDAAQTCLEKRQAIEAGDGRAVLDAVACCAAGGLAMPGWLAVEFMRRHGSIETGEARDWNDDAAFGHALPKGANVAGVRAQHKYGGAAYRAAALLLAEDPDRPVDRLLYEDAGEQIGIGQTQVQERIDGCLEACEWARPPLTHLRDMLQSGLPLLEALHAWEAFRADCITDDLPSYFNSGKFKT